MPSDREQAPQAPEAWWARPQAGAGDPQAPSPAHPAAQWSGARTVVPGATRPASRPAPRPTPRPAGSRPPAFGDQRGLTAAGATILVVVLSTLGAVVDVTTGTGLRTAFTVAFVVAAALAAAAVHREDLVASVVLVPLVFAAVAGISGLFEGSGLGSLTKLVEAVAITMVNAAPALMMATAAALVIALARGVSHRRARRGAGGLAGRAHA